MFYGKTGRGKTHLATALGMSAVDWDMSVRFLPTAELVLQLGRAKHDGTLETMLKDIARADLTIPARSRPHTDLTKNTSCCCSSPPLPPGARLSVTYDTG